MTKKISFEWLLMLPMLAGLFFASPLLMAAEPAVYRCGPAGSQWYSQIPCENDSEKVVIEDHLMIRESANTGLDQVIEAEIEKAEDEADRSSNAESFIAQLEKQRSEQLDEIDRNIMQLESSLENPEATDPDDADAAAKAEANARESRTLLASLQSTRENIVSEYNAMISAARERIDQP